MVSNARSGHGMASVANQRTSDGLCVGWGRIVARGCSGERDEHDTDVRPRIHADERGRINIEPDFFEGLAARAFLYRLADLEEAAGEGPISGARLDRPPLEQYAAAVRDDDAGHDARVEVMDEAAALALQADTLLSFDEAFDEVVSADLAVAWLRDALRHG